MTLELEIVVTEGKGKIHNTTDVILLNNINEKTGTYINHMYIDDINIIKTEIQ